MLGAVVIAGHYPGRLRQGLKPSTDGTLPLLPGARCSWLWLLEDVAAYRLKCGSLPATWQSWKTRPHQHTLHYVPAIQRTTAKGKQVTLSTSDAEHKGLIYQQLEQGKRLAVYIPCREAALGFADVVQRKWPQKRTVVVVGSRSADI